MGRVRGLSQRRPRVGQGLLDPGDSAVWEGGTEAGEVQNVPEAGSRTERQMHSVFSQRSGFGDTSKEPQAACP